MVIVGSADEGMNGEYVRGSTRTSRRATLRGTGTVLATAIPILGGCAAPVPRMNDTTTDEDDGWGLSVAVGPDGEPVFEPGTEIPLHVQPGTTVSFEWESDGHDLHVMSQPDEADWEGHESIEDAGFIHEHTFIVVGRYRFFCERHRDEGMIGDIIVGDCDCGPPTRTTATE